MTQGELERWETVIRTSGTIEAIRELQRRGELDKEGTLIKNNLKGAIHRRAKVEKQESSDEEKKRGRKMPGGVTKYINDGE